MSKQENKVSVQDQAVAELSRIKYADESSCTTNDVDKAIASAVSAVRSGRVSVQKAGVVILLHAYKHGDYSKATVLVEALGNGINARALVEWFCKFGGLRTKDGEKGFVGWSGAEYIRDNLDRAKAFPWWTCKQENPWQGFDLQKQFERILKQVSKAADKAVAEPDLADKVRLHVDADIKQRILNLLQDAQ